MESTYNSGTDEFISGGKEGSPDPGRAADAIPPLSPDEYEKLKEEARKENEE
jgi:hypothetical protein